MSTDGENGTEGQPRPSPSDAEIVAVARRIVREAACSPADAAGDQIIAAQHELASEDEDRVEAAVVALRAAAGEHASQAARGVGRGAAAAPGHHLDDPAPEEG